MEDEETDYSITWSICYHTHAAILISTRHIPSNKERSRAVKYIFIVCTVLFHCTWQVFPLKRACEYCSDDHGKNYSKTLNMLMCEFTTTFMAYQPILACNAIHRFSRTHQGQAQLLLDKQARETPRQCIQYHPCPDSSEGVVRYICCICCPPFHQEHHRISSDITSVPAALSGVVCSCAK